ncbi:MAG TPA: acetylornithine/succinylornithine family transaminase [Phycisphaerae bacterium]|nr:acetylornithine/succinylornithine family transaminase [Phycisphaerae bacterium]
MTNASLIARHQNALILNYGKLPAALVRGQGSRLTDADGHTYLDLFAGFGGTILGHCHPALVAAVTRQANTLWATGNQFYTEPQIRLAEHLQAKAFDGRAFFCHSGAEANEAAIKLARLAAANASPNNPPFKIISFLKGFHGRTLGALSATPTPDYQKGFTPLIPGFTYVPYNDLAALQDAIDPQTCAVLVEPIQGEGGINVPDPHFLAGVRALCDQHHLTLIFDEVWTGCGRTGAYFGHQLHNDRNGGGVIPDIMTLGKALGGGVPVACMFAKPRLAALLKPGTHGCTLGGNPICAAIAAAVFDVLEQENLPAQAAQKGKRIVEALASFKNTGKIKQIRGTGLFLGVELHAPDAGPVVQAALAAGLIINATSKNVLRIAPALTIPAHDLEEALPRLDQALSAV